MLMIPAMYQCTALSVPFSKTIWIFILFLLTINVILGYKLLQHCICHQGMAWVPKIHIFKNKIHCIKRDDDSVGKLVLI